MTTEEREDEAVEELYAAFAAGAELERLTELRFWSMTGCACGLKEELRAENSWRIEELTGDMQKPIRDEFNDHYGRALDLLGYETGGVLEQEFKDGKPVVVGPDEVSERAYGLLEKLVHQTDRTDRIRKKTSDILSQYVGDDGPP